MTAADRLRWAQAVSPDLSMPTPESHPLEVFYHKPSDTLYLSLGKAQPSIAQELVGDLLVQHLPKTNTIVGLAILNLSQVAQMPVIVPILVTMQAMPEKTG